MRETLLSYLPEFLDRGEDTALMGRAGLRTDYWSYRRVAETAFQVARELGARGLGLGDRLVLWEDNSPAWVATFLGCLMRGVVVVPLDVQSSPEFVAGIERQTRPKLVLGGGSGASLEGLKSPTDSVAGFCRSAAAQAATPDWSYAGKVTGDHLAQIVFTSGTTAAPKGIRLTHRNLLANLTPLEREIRKYARWAAPVHPLRFLSLLPLSHVFGQMMGIFVPPLLGGQALFLNTLNPSEIISAIRRERISMLATVPRVLELLRDKIERDEAARNPRRPLAELFDRSAGRHWLRRWWTFRHVRRRFGWKFWAFLSGGATLDSGTEEFWKRLGYAVMQGYGMTEAAAVISLVHPFRPGRGSIGKPMPGQEIKLDEGGEILVRGRNVSPGYWGAEDASLTDDEGWLRTGDLGQRDEKGNLYFRGRRKEVIVTSAGLNVYPADIEASLNQQPEIGACAVVGVEGAQGPEPVAVLIPRSPEADPSAAVQRANQGLSPYQQIRRWVVWPERDFPRTATQKVRKRDLVRFAIRQGRKPAGQVGDNPEGLRGEILAIAESITGTAPQRRDRQANLTSDLKLDSLARVALITRLEDRFRMDLDESRVTEALTLGDLEELLRRPDGLPEEGQSEVARPSSESGGDLQAPSEARPDPGPSRPAPGNFGQILAPLSLSHLVLEAAGRLDALPVPARSHLAAHPLALLAPGERTQALARTSGARAGDRQPRDLLRSGAGPGPNALALPEPAGHRHDRRKTEGLPLPAAGARAGPLHRLSGLRGDRRRVQRLLAAQAIRIPAQLRLRRRGHGPGLQRAGLSGGSPHPGWRVAALPGRNRIAGGRTRGPGRSRQDRGTA